MQNYDKLYIDGAWVLHLGAGTIDVINASTEAVMGRVPEGTPEDVDRAVAAAHDGVPHGGQTPVDERRLRPVDPPGPAGAREQRSRPRSPARSACR